MSERREPSGAQKAYGDFAPESVRLTDEVMFGPVWPRAESSPKERSLVTVACLIAGGNTEQLVYHLDLARQNGATEAEWSRRSPTPRSTPAGRRRSPRWPSPSRSSAAPDRSSAMAHSRQRE
jgi:4-carboxymuconolactone decarboxylase